MSTGIWVNASNPIKQITLAQAQAVFTTGGEKGDITDWSQLGVEGDWGPVPIHPYVTRDTAAILAMIDEIVANLAGRPFTYKTKLTPTGAMPTHPAPADAE